MQTSTYIVVHPLYIYVCKYINKQINKQITNTSLICLVMVSPNFSRCPAPSPYAGLRSAFGTAGAPRTRRGSESPAAQAGRPQHLPQGAHLVMKVQWICLHRNAYVYLHVDVYTDVEVDMEYIFIYTYIHMYGEEV